ncbi:MAG: secretin N-terminal domain-containing protein [Kiritimatiellia bacterium]
MTLKSLLSLSPLLSLLPLLTLLSLVVATALPAQAQGLQRNSLLNRRLTRPTTPAAAQAAAPAATPAADGAADATGPGGRSIEFNGAPVEMVFVVYGNLVGKTVLKDPQVPSATITLQPRKGQELTDEDKIEAIETVLEMNGIHMEKYGEKFVRAIPRKDVRKEGIPLIMDPETKLGESSRVVSLMIPFKNISTEEAQKALEGFKSNSGILLVFERTNSILATDTEQNINRMLEIAKAIDVASPVAEVVEYIQIKHANASEVKQVIDSIVQESMKEQEKNGKAPQNSAAARTQPANAGPGARSLLRRPGAEPQPAAPVNNESLVMTVSDADRGMIRGKVVTIADERSNKILIITNASNMKFFKDVIAALDVETTPDTAVKVYRLKYADAEDVSDMINDLIGNSSSSKNSGKANQNQNAKQGTSGSVTRNTTTPQAAAKRPANQRSGEAKAGELNKDNTTVLADKRINGIVVMTNRELIPTIEQIIESMDVKLSQVLIETVIIEVGLGDGIETGMDWVQHGRQRVATDKTDALGQRLAYRQRTYTETDDEGKTVKTWTQLDDVLVPQWYSKSETSGNVTLTESASDVIAQTTRVATDGLLNYYSGGTATAIGGGQSGEAAYNIVRGVSSNVFGKAFNFVFSSDELGLTAILQATKTDSRSKYIASPVIMTLDNKEAVINATAMHYLLKGFTSSGNSYSTIAVPDYEQKELGIEIKVTPKINPNGTVMLTVEEKYTQLGPDEAIQYSTGTGGDAGLRTVNVPTTVTREMSSDVLLENNQTVVFGGLTERTVSESDSGIPFLKDIPIIGKWLFGTVNQSENRTELLVFMTPYVLDDAQAAQAEALRRKKTLSDARAWDDNGWSLSELADPVSKKEQMRRLKDEWKKQDEERQTRLEIEKAKLERAKKLQSLSKEERDLWLKLHKEELEEEQQEELERRMLDKESQEELKKLAAQVREQKLAEAKQELDAAEAETSAQNERAKRDAEQQGDAK